MKNKIIISLFTLVLIALVISCKKETPPPTACLSGPITAKVNEPIEFENCSQNASHGSLWTGDETKVYALNNDTTTLDRRGRIVYNRGVNFPSGTKISYSYKTAGTFTVTLVASSPADWGENVFKDVVEQVITITE
jgi:hypothetical protein